MANSLETPANDALPKRRDGAGPRSSDALSHHQCNRENLAYCHCYKEAPLPQWLVSVSIATALVC